MEEHISQDKIKGNIMEQHIQQDMKQGKYHGTSHTTRQEIM